MAAADIVIKGAREHNLREVDLTLPRNRLICLTGVSGSGKSSLAFDTLYAEGQRRYVESLSSFARQFLGQMPKPDVDYIGGLSPSISISQKSSGQNPRSTVGTITEIYDYLRVLYARARLGHCPQYHREITAQTREQIIDRIAELPSGSRFSVLAPVVRAQKGEYRDLFVDLLKQGFVRARVDGEVVQLTDNLKLDRQMRHTIEVVVDRLVVGEARTRMAEAVDLALRLGSGNLIIALETGKPSESGKASAAAAARSAAAAEDRANKDNEARDSDSQVGDSGFRHKAAAPAAPAARKKRSARSDKVDGDLQLSAHYACTHCGLSFEPPSPQLFSFNSPQGMCGACSGLGHQYTFVPERLVTNPAASFKQGCIELIGAWRDLGRWKRHIFAGVAHTVERKHELPAGTMLDTPWRDLAPELQNLWLNGTGDLHVTFTWRAGGHGQKYGGHFEGVIPQLLSRHRNSQSKMQIRQLEKYMSVLDCPDCGGARLNPQASAVTLATRHAQFAANPALSLPAVCHLAIADAVNFFDSLALEGSRARVADEILKEIRGRLGFLTNVGLDYLTLDRTAPTLSGGESQRIRLAGQIGCGLVGVLYILDEPSIGLHPRDNDRLLDTLTTLRDLGNTVVVVEHDEDTMRAADHIIDFGPGPGVRGGEVVACGSVSDLSKAPRSLTGQYLAGKLKIEEPERTRPLTGKVLRIVNARHNNLTGVDVEIPLGSLVCVTGVSGSGKSSLVNDILADSLHRDLNGGESQPGLHDRIEGLEHLDKLIAIDQSPIGRTPRSNPSTYIKLFDEIRDLYTQLPESKARGYKAGRFSFNVAGGRCEACEGNGSNKLDMDFLADVWVTCPVCEGRRFNRETLQVRFKGKSISDVLEMDVQDAITHFENVPKIRHKLQTLHDVGLDYLKLGQPSPTLSGGEAQRVKLARELVKRSTGRTLYLLDEPTTGLHFADIKLLLKVLHGFVDVGNTVLVVEHNLDVIKTADWIIDMGPEGGGGGGKLVATGTPREVAKIEGSYTGQALSAIFEPATRAAPHRKPAGATVQAHQSIRLRGARQHNLKDVAVEIPRDRMTVCCGMSGSGKSSLAMDTIYAEGQRRYVESLSSYARQFVGQMQKPALDHIEGLSPAIAIEQKHLGHTPRSTVGTVTEVYDYLRILMARLGEPYCPDCDLPIGTQTADEIIDTLLTEPPGTKLFIMAPLEVAVGERYEALWEDMRSRGFVRVRIDGQTCSLDEAPTIDRRRKHAVEVVIDRLVVRPDARARLADTVEQALSLGRGVLHVAYPSDEAPEPKWRVEAHSQHFACDRCGRSFDRLTPHSFSFNSSLGWCISCEGLGTQIGADPAALLRDPKLTLAEGAVAVWPVAGNPLFASLLAALSAHTGVPIDMPFDQLSARQRRVLFYGLEDEWIDVYPAGKRTKADKPLFRFQFKGFYPAVEEAARLSPALRARWDSLVGEVECSTCGGSRLRDDAGAVRLRGRTVDGLCRMPLGQLMDWFNQWKLDKREQKIAGELVREVRNRLQFLLEVGLEYLSLGRPAPTLSGGEAQRIRLASQVGSGLCGVLYVLDEPTIGLHPRDNRRLIGALEKLRDLGNTLLVVEHDREVLAAADLLLDFGPAAGDAGGQIVARGTPAQVARQKDSVTGPFLSGKKAIAVPTNRRLFRPGSDDGAANGSASGRGMTAKARASKTKTKAGSQEIVAAPAVPFAPGGWLEIVGARHHNLRNITARFPLGCFTVVCGVSGSGKSSLVEDVMCNALAKALHRASTTPGAHDLIRGLEYINKVIRVDQQPLGNTPTSNPATYTGVFDLIRNLFAQLPESRLRGYTARRFSFNVPGGRCEACEGNGQLRIEMHFLPDVWVECETCGGKRYNPETLAVRYHGQTIADVLEMSCAKAARLFENIPQVRRILQTLCDVGLDYVRLGQPAPTLSGGEAQRVKLAAELARPDTGRTLYLLDEPTTGLHFEDVAKLLDVLNRLVDLGNSVVVIEHNLDVIKTADWVIEMGPEAGQDGGYIVAAGAPEDVVAHAAAWQAAHGAGASNRQAAIAGPAAKPGKKARSPRPAATSAPAPPDPRLMRSHTGEALRDVLAAGPHRDRGVHDFAAATERRAGDVDIAEVGRDAPMPWEADGRRWHTVDRVGRDGAPCQWDGRALSEVVDRVQDLGEFSETNWNSRTIVEIASAKKSEGWFFHASTGEQWLLKLKFRTAKNVFQRDSLIADLGLKPLNDLPDLPVYGHEPRVKVKNIPGPWQEIQLQVHAFEEIDRPAFWKFLERAVAGYFKVTERTRQNPEDVMPWKVLGQKWHFARKGFPPGRPPQWDTETLEELCEILQQAAPHGQMLWNNQQVVHMFVAEQHEPWASLWTKRAAALELTLTGPSGHFALGRVAELGSDREFVSGRGRDVVKLRFQTMLDIERGDLHAFVREHLATLTGDKRQAVG